MVRKKQTGPGRPRKPPTEVISVPANRVEAVEAALGRKIIKDQTPVYKIRVYLTEIKKARRAIEGETK